MTRRQSDSPTSPASAVKKEPSFNSAFPSSSETPLITSGSNPKIVIKTFPNQHSFPSNSEPTPTKDSFSKSDSFPTTTTATASDTTRENHHPTIRLSLKRHNSTNNMSEKSSQSKKKCKSSKLNGSHSSSRTNSFNESFESSTSLPLEPKPVNASSSPVHQPKLKLRLQLPKHSSTADKKDNTRLKSLKKTIKQEPVTQPPSIPSQKILKPRIESSTSSISSSSSRLPRRRGQAAKRTNTALVGEMESLNPLTPVIPQVATPPTINKQEPVEDDDPWVRPDSNPQKNKKFFRIGPGFKRTHQNFNIVDTLGNNIYAILACRIDRGFHHVGNEWITYRRNYITISTAYSLTSGDVIEYGKVPRCNLFLDLGEGEKAKIEYFSLRISAVEVDFLRGFQDVALIQHTPKRNRGVKRAPPLVPAVPGLLPSHEFIKNNTTFRTSTRKKVVEKYITYPKSKLGEFAKYYPSSIETGDNIPFVGVFERIQFTTPIGGDSRQVKTMVQLVATLDTGEAYIVAWSETPYFTLRIRSPSSYGDNVSLVQRKNGTVPSSPTLPRAIIQMMPGKPKIVSKFKENEEDEDAGTIENRDVSPIGHTELSSNTVESSSTNVSSSSMLKTVQEATGKVQKIAPNPENKEPKKEMRYKLLSKSGESSHSGPSPYLLYKALQSADAKSAKSSSSPNSSQKTKHDSSGAISNQEIQPAQPNPTHVDANTIPKVVKVAPKPMKANLSNEQPKKSNLPLLQPHPGPVQIAGKRSFSEPSAARMNSMLQSLKTITAKSKSKAQPKSKPQLKPKLKPKLKAKPSSSMFSSPQTKLDLLLGPAIASSSNTQSSGKSEASSQEILPASGTTDVKGKGEGTGKVKSPTLLEPSTEAVSDDSALDATLVDQPSSAPSKPSGPVPKTDSSAGSVTDSSATPANSTDSKQNPDVLKLVEISYSEPRNPVALNDSSNNPLRILPSGSLFSAPSMPAPRNTGKVFKVGRRQVRRNWSDHQTIFKFTKISPPPANSNPSASSLPQSSASFPSSPPTLASNTVIQPEQNGKSSESLKDLDSVSATDSVQIGNSSEAHYNSKASESQL